MLNPLGPNHILNVIYLEVMLIKTIFTEKTSFTAFLHLCRINYCRSSNMAEVGPDAEAADESQEAIL